MTAHKHKKRSARILQERAQAAGKTLSYQRCRQLVDRHIEQNPGGPNGRLTEEERAAAVLAEVLRG